MMPDAPFAAVVLRYRDGRAERCRLTCEFSPRGTDVEITTEEGERRRVGLSDLKAVFFLKDPRIRGVQMDIGESAGEPPGGALARVEFFDGEIIRGRVDHYSVGNSGFFLYPTAVESNNERVFVVATALSTVIVES